MYTYTCTLLNGVQYMCDCILLNGVQFMWDYTLLVQIAFCPGTRGRDEGWCGESFLCVCFCLFVCPFQQCVPVVIVINHISVITNICE